MHTHCRYRKIQFSYMYVAVHEKLLQATAAGIIAGGIHHLRHPVTRSPGHPVTRLPGYPVTPYRGIGVSEYRSTAGLRLSTFRPYDLWTFDFSTFDPSPGHPVTRSPGHPVSGYRSIGVSEYRSTAGLRLSTFRPYDLWTFDLRPARIS